MTLILDLTPQQEQQIEAQARARNMDARTYALARLFEDQPVEHAEEKQWSGADLVAYWEKEGVIGSRPDITDSQEHARAIRRKAERRGRD